MSRERQIQQRGLRFAEREDLEKILEIERASFPIPWDYKFFEAALDNFFLVYEEEEVLGYLVAFCCYKNIRAIIAKLAVHPHHRGRGIATSLLREILKILAENNIEEVELDVKMMRKDAIRLYEKFGFKIVAAGAANAEEESFYTMKLKLQNK